MTERSDRPGTPTVFREKRTYRRRRMIDAARLAPLVVLFLWLLPMAWPQDGLEQISSATAFIYIFGIWAVVIMCNWALSRALRHSLDDGADTDT
ncbi:hypothetical protein [Marivita sp. S2033]|uniref:hypothetical protein n=1 Tax=Marivita sp. S2033 TaxID=3373187 RepID=UPI00398197EA